MPFGHGHVQTKTLQRGSIDAIGLRLDTNSPFFCNHFANGLPDDVRAEWEHGGISNFAQLSSQRTFLKVGHCSFLRASIPYFGPTEDNHGEKSTGVSYRPFIISIRFGF